MRFITLASLAIVLGIGLLTGCTSKDGAVSQAQRSSGQTSQAPAASSPADTARRITAEEAHKLYERGNVLFVDTRTEPPFKESRIKGAILIPVNEVAAKAGELPRDKTIVTYCT